MYKEIINKIYPDMDKSIEFFKEELKKIRAGRANPSLVEDILVECFGQKLPLKQLASISCADARQLVIQPWDPSYIQPIERAISKSDIGINPISEKTCIRISLPSLSNEYRQQLLKLIAGKQEDTKNVVRHLREKAWSEIQEASRVGDVSEDDKFRAKEELQKIVDNYSQKIKELADAKQEEVKL